VRYAGFDAVTTKRPVGSDVKANDPSTVVIVLRDRVSPAPLTVTIAPPSGVRCVSSASTVPEMRAVPAGVALCAAASAVSAIASAKILI
jgi:hypothetical protein